MSAAAPLVEIRGLVHDYSAARLFGRQVVRRALDGVSLRIGRGAIVGLVGESGSGKSTLARLAMALARPTAGTVLFEGEDLFALSPEALRRRRRDFQMVFQDPFGSLDPRMRVGRIVAEPLHVLSPRPGREERRARVGAMLESVGLPARAAERYPHEFSGGQRQRIAIARALVTEPKLVIADEAVSALDLSVQAQVINLILDLRDRLGIAFLFVSHDLSVIDCIADEVAVLFSGRLVESGPAHGLFDRPLHPYTRLLADAAPSLRRPGRADAAAAAAMAGGGCAFAPRCAMASGRCRVERPALVAAGGGRLVACHNRLDG